MYSELLVACVGSMLLNSSKGKWADFYIMYTVDHNELARDEYQLTLWLNCMHLVMTTLSLAPILVYDVLFV